MITMQGTSEKPIRELDIVKMVDALNGDEKMFVSIDVVLEIIDEEQKEYNMAYEALANVYNRVLALKGDTQWQA